MNTKDVYSDVVEANSSAYSRDELGEKTLQLVEKLSVRPDMDKIYVVQSFTNPEKKYIITKTRAGKWECTCPMFKFNIPRGRYLHKAYKLPNGELVCKHVAWVYQNEHRLIPVYDRVAGANLNSYAINVVDWDSTTTRILTLGSNNQLVAQQPEPEEEIILFKEDYERLNISEHKEKEREKDIGIDGVDIGF